MFCGRWAKKGCFSLFWFVASLFLMFCSIFHLHTCLLLISQSLQCMFCGRWAENGCFSFFLVYYYTLPMFRSIFYLHGTLLLVISFPEAADTVD